MTTGSVYNATSGPLVIDEEGHQLGGRERQPGVNLDSPRIKAHIDGGRLVATPDPVPPVQVKPPKPAAPSAADKDKD